MKRPVLTAVLLLLHLLSLPQVSTLALAVTLSSQFMPHQAKLDSRIREMNVHASVDPKDGYKNGTLEIRVGFGARPAAGMKAIAEVSLAGNGQAYF